MGGGGGGIRKLSLGFNLLSQKSLSDLEQAKLSEVNPLHWTELKFQLMLKSASWIC